MTEPHDRPPTSEEMVEQAKRAIARDEQPAAKHDSTRPTADTPDRAVPAPQRRRARMRPRPVELKRPPADPTTQRRAVLLVAIALALVVFGMVAALLFAIPGG